MGGKQLALVARAVALAVHSRIQAVAEFFDQHTQKLGVCAQARQPLAVDKHLGAARRAVRGEGSHGTGHLLARSQSERDLACACQPLLPHSLGLAPRIGLAGIARQQRLQLLRAVGAQEVLHRQASLGVDLSQPALQGICAVRPDQHQGSGRPGIWKRADRPCACRRSLTEVELARAGQRGLGAELRRSRFLPQPVLLGSRPGRLQGSGRRRGRQKPTRLQALQGKAARATALLRRGEGQKGRRTHRGHDGLRR